MKTVANGALMVEAKEFGKYLIGEDINERAVSLYVEVHKKNNFELDEKDARILRFVLKYPFWIGFIDGGLVIQKNKSCLRKKLFYLLAILETMPEYAGCFLFQQQSMINIPSFIFFGVRGAIRLGVGYFLCKIL